MISPAKPQMIVLLLATWLVPAFGWAQVPQEASRVRILLVLDTNDKLGDTWGLDGENMQRVLKAALGKQKMGARSTMDVFTGGKVNAETILAYYANLKTQPTESLLFYYSGHGGLNANKGHFLALTAGHFYRKDLLDAMKKHNPRLLVVLTDCCANPAGGAVPVEPTNYIVNVIKVTGDKNPRALKEEPTGQVRTMTNYQMRAFESQRPNIQELSKGKQAKKEEPPHTTAALARKLAPAGPKARLEEPLGQLSNNVNLITGTGTLTVETIARQTDGEVLRHLLFRNQGIVDINGCKKGELSLGSREWGGSVFTIAFMALQKEKIAAFDKNGDKLVEWSEFFPRWVAGTGAASQRATHGKSQQIPEAFQLKALPIVK